MLVLKWIFYWCNLLPCLSINFVSNVGKFMPLLMRKGLDCLHSFSTLCVWITDWRLKCLQRAVRRIYGEKSGDIIEGLKRNPVVAVPLVLRRLRAKDEEWREVQKNFNKIWRDQVEIFHGFENNVFQLILSPMYESLCRYTALSFSESL